MEFDSLEACQQSGKHLTSCDSDGFCNFCGYQEADYDDDEEDIVG